MFNTPLQQGWEGYRTIRIHWTWGPRAAAIMPKWQAKPLLLKAALWTSTTCPCHAVCKNVFMCVWKRDSETEKKRCCEWLHFRQGIPSRAFCPNLSREPRLLAESCGSPPPSFHPSDLQLSLQRLQADTDRALHLIEGLYWSIHLVAH